MKRIKSLEELDRRIEEVKGLPIGEAERALGVRMPSDNLLTRIFCKVGLHKRDIVSGAAHGETHIGCLRPSCMRILGW